MLVNPKLHARLKEVASGNCHVCYLFAEWAAEILAALPGIPDGYEIKEGEPEQGDYVLINGKACGPMSDSVSLEPKMWDGYLSTSDWQDLGGILLRKLPPVWNAPITKEELPEVVAGLRLQNQHGKVATILGVYGDAIWVKWGDEAPATWSRHSLECLCPATEEDARLLGREVGK